MLLYFELVIYDFKKSNFMNHNLFSSDSVGIGRDVLKEPLEI